MSKRLKFGDEVIHATTITTSGEVPMPDTRIISKGEEVPVVAYLKLNEYGLKDLDGPVTLVHKTKLSRAAIVEEEFIADVLAEEVEYTTGQLQLLSGTGEARRAVRLMREERQRQIDVCGHSIDHDDEHDTDAFALLIEDEIEQLRIVVGNADGYDVPDYLEALEHELVQIGALAVAGVEHVRRRLNEHLEAESRRKAQERAEQEAAAAKAMAVHSDEEADKRERRELGEDEADQQDEETEQERDEEVAAV